MPSGALAQPEAMVPAPFRRLYAELDRKLAEIEDAVVGRYGDAQSPVIFTPELITVNSNRGPQLLAPGTTQATSLLLDRFQEMGVGGVILSINYPLLTPAFPRFEEYLAPYRSVVADVRSRGLTLAVETTTIFPDPEFSPIGIDYTGLTLEEYQRGKREQAALVVGELGPDFLTVENESTTVTRNTGLPFPVDDYLATVRSTIAGLDRSRTRVGAGSGTWDDLDLFARLATETDVDYIDLHIYPVLGDLLWDKPQRIAEIAHANGKALSVGESWLYKLGSGEPAASPATAVEVFGRDMYSFWAPLDQRFLRAVTTLARGLEMAFCSSFWSQFFFAYVDYTDEIAGLPYAERARMANMAVTRALVEGRLSSTGEVYKRLIR
jgi:hypothetical protein